MSLAHLWFYTLLVAVILIALKVVQKSFSEKEAIAEQSLFHRGLSLVEFSKIFQLLLIVVLTLVVVFFYTQAEIGRAEEISLYFLMAILLTNILTLKNS